MDAGDAIRQTSRVISHIKIPMLMRLSRLLLVTLLIGFAVLPSLHAQDQTAAAPSAPASPYSVIVPVTDTTPAQRDAAFSSALVQVLTRIAGGRDLRSNPGYDGAMKNPGSLVRRYQYQRAAGGLSLQVDFEPGTVRRLVSTTLNVPSAGVKPPVLLLVQGADGQLFDRSSLGSLASAAGARGTSVSYPDADNPPDVGKVSAAERDRLLEGARALLFPGEEDFGIVPVEAQAAGLPVLAYGVGGAAETVLDGRTGVLFAEQSADGLASAIESFETLTLDAEAIRENARRFGRERFRGEMADVIDRASRASRR